MVRGQHSSHLPVAEYWQRQNQRQYWTRKPIYKYWSVYIQLWLILDYYNRKGRAILQHWGLIRSRTVQPQEHCHMAKRSRPNRIVCVIVHTSTFYPIAQYFYTLREVFQLSPLQTRYFFVLYYTNVIRQTQS